MLTKNCRKLIAKSQLHSARLFSVETSSSDSGTDTDSQTMKNVIDPHKNQYTDFLKNVSVYEEHNKDSLKTMYFLDSGKRLAGYATPEGTEKYYRMS